jgi:hypothetical protein
MLTFTRNETQDGYDSTQFRIDSYSQSERVTPAEFMHGCLKKMVGDIRSIEPVRKS